MKKNRLVLIVMVMVLMSINGCKKVETEPLERLTVDYIFDEGDRNAVYADLFLNNIYSYLPDGFNRVGGNLLDAGTDDALPTRNASTVEYFVNGRLTPANNPDAAWGDCYAGIRRVNIFLKNIDIVPADAQRKQYWRAEARFIRAMLYFEMLKRYGGIPLIGDKIFGLNDKIDVSRNTFAECVSYIVSECEDIKGKLQIEPVVDTDLGRMTRGCALALKSRLLLYAASPLFNGGGFETDPAKKALTGYLDYKESRWQDALNAAEELIGKYALEANFIDVFIKRKNNEVIMAKQRVKTFDVESNNAPVGFIETGAVSKGLTSPTQELADAYTNDSGVPVPNSHLLANPYAARDSRFALTFFFNGSDWLKRKVQSYEGGLDKPNTPGSEQTRTGYYMRKFMANFATNTTYTNQDHNFIIFRYAEVLLNYAEALNELNRTEDAVNQIKLLRIRAKIKAGTGNRYGIKAGISQTEMRALIQNERRVELAFEEHRFWDIRRWKIAQQVLNGKLHGMKATLNGSTVTYEPFEAATVVFAPRMYHIPLPYGETTKNTNLVQNEGW
ncbi:RagB/SusD family nutrient uptake outer membrane protein [Pedobacter heparinus]|uniref:RagB/SusD domain protein n=1 Tax=Pedobacter heparinus (strain ATCC 13125 / DSM 2366 / CIP 104194 / JCM 7457 / NBRC 12017 / NCIMB 9290 / NRRL B-14731 / HIM 762-3) TaxID=485917 RepID=C6XY28_PEDHD|nr:RagB/SusD family nutrient uptake outer membrane protein [Pedobacter heparinus]ACU04446.1 RagB/SusD domain protein [Pedobacter heparinus DSM 2366]